MKSRTSLFNWGVSRSLLRRFWPLWTGYFVILLLSLPALLPRYVHLSNPEMERLSADQTIAGNSLGLLFWTALVGVIIAGAMFGYLYRSRLCGLMNSLPIRRETMFCTAYLTGLVPLLLADLLAVLAAGAIGLPGGVVSLHILLQWLGMAVLGNLAFYSFAVFCAVLTGHRAFLPLLFLMLNFIVGLIVLCAQGLLDLTLYGYAMNFPEWALFLTPPAYLASGFINNLTVAIGAGNEANIHLTPIAIYAGLSLLFLLLGFLLYRRRQMEAAGDVVAVPWLKPVLKYLFCLGFALVFTIVLLTLTDRGGDKPGLFPLLISLLISCFLGYFISEMLLRRTVKVFRGAWRGFFVTAAALTAFALCVQLDLFGFERYLPAPEELQSVSLSGAYRGHLESPEKMAAAVELHREAIALRERKSDGEEYSRFETISYKLKNGRTVTREYFITKAMEKETIRLCNEPESLVYRFSESAGIRREYIESADLSVKSGSGQFFKSANYQLTPDELMDLMENGVRPDARLGRIDRAGNDVYHGATRYYVKILLKTKIDANPTLITITVDADSENTIRWIREYLQSGSGQKPTEL